MPLGWWERLEVTAGWQRYESTLNFATTLVQDGVTGVTVVLPRAPGVLVRARAAAQRAGVLVRAEFIGNATITLRFRASAEPGGSRDDAAAR